MSRNLHWAPVVANTKTLPDQLKYKLRDLFGDPVDLMLTEEYLLQLNVLRVCNIEGAAQLIALIEKHGQVRIWEE